MLTATRKSTFTSSTEWLRNEFIKRKEKNNRYTLRAFSKHLDIPPGRLSELLSGKRQITFNLAQKITEQLDCSSHASNELLQILKGERKVGEKFKVSKSSQYTDLSAEMFDVIADWQYFAILSLLKLRTFREDPSWIGRRLGISSTEVRSAIDKMLRLGVLTTDKNGKLVRVAEQFVTTYGVPSTALRRSHKQSLEMAIDAIENVPLHLRDITSITFPADLSKIPLVKKTIKLFERRIAKLMASPEATAVYNMNVQLVPITKE